MTTKDTTSCGTESGNKFTTVKTIYARAAVVLLALNFCVTGYVIINMNDVTQAQIEGITESASTKPFSQKVTSQTPTTTESQGEKPTVPSTRENQ